MNSLMIECKSNYSDCKYIGVINKLYNLGNILDYSRFVYGAEALSYYLKTTKGEYAVKVYLNCDEVHLQFETSLVTYLYENGLSVPKVIKTKNNQNYSIYENTGYVVFDYIIGDQLIVEQINVGQAHRLGESVGLLHKFVQKSALLSHKEARGIEYINNVYQILLNLPSNYSNDYEFNHNRIIFMKEHNRLEELLVENSWKCMKGLIHSDLTLDNVIYNNDKVSIIDFGDAGNGYLLMDLAILILGASIIPNQCKNDIAKAIIEGYYSVQHLFKQEKDELLNMLQVACLRKAAAYFDYFVTKNIILQKNKEFLDKLPYLKEFEI